MNAQDLEVLTERWHQHTNSLNGSIDDAFKSCQDHAYAVGYRRGREDLIELRAALGESLKLQSHYAELLNMFDGGKRKGFASVGEWLEALKKEEAA